MEKKREKFENKPQNAAATNHGTATAKNYTTGGAHTSTRPEQGPDVPPEERTVGIP